MKNLIVGFMVMSSLFGIFGCSSDPSKWSDEKLNKWFEKGEWLNGWNVQPDSSINRKEFAMSYFKNKERWDKAFNFLRSNDLSKIELKKHEIDSTDLFATASEYLSKNPEDARFEAHRKYIDIQYVAAGVEQMGVAPLSKQKTITSAYNPDKDIEFSTVSDSSLYTANPQNFFIFFPSDIHRPGVKVGDNGQVRKIVIKVKAD